MTNDNTGHDGPADRFDQVAAILKSYPDISEDELRELNQWFRTASAFDTASLTANDAFSAQYARYRADHIDRFSLKDMLGASAGVIILAGVIAGIGYLAP